MGALDGSSVQDDQVFAAFAAIAEGQAHRLNTMRQTGLRRYQKLTGLCSPYLTLPKARIRRAHFLAARLFQNGPRGQGPLRSRLRRALDCSGPF